MKEFKRTDNFLENNPKVNLGDKVFLAKQECEVIECEVSHVKMLNIDADQLEPGDLKFIKKLGLTISNPETDKPIALGEEYKSFGRKLADWFTTPSEDNDDDDDSSFFSPTPSSSGSIFGGSSSFGGFGGGFGGFGGGSFGGGGASRGF